jgi:hypothetical protein
LLWCMEAPMVMVETDELVVERDLVEGRIVCPDCGGVLVCWGWARWRVVRVEGGVSERRRPRRARCRQCGKSHVLLGRDCLARRRDGVGVIGSALAAKAFGGGYRPIAERLGLPGPTVRGWFRRFAGRAEVVRVHFMVWAHALDPELTPIGPAGSLFADAVEAVAVAGRAAVLRFGPRPAWEVASALTGGRLLSNTSSPWPVV